jgi:hypothetical protein
MKDFHLKTINSQTTTQFSCYTCTNDNSIIQTNVNYPNDAYNYRSSLKDCGSTFLASNPLIEQKMCNTSCMKRETGIYGYSLNIERRCVKTCAASDSSYSIENTNPKYIIDRISCCSNNLCNHAKSDKMIKINLVIISIISSLYCNFN